MKRLLAIILSLIMVAGVLPAMGIAVSAAAYSGTVATAFSAGLGTEASPYEIGTAEELYYFASLVNEGEASIHAKLTANIVVNEKVFTDDGSLNGTPTYTWTPIGNSTNKYTGTFEGAGYSVSGLYFDDSTTDYVGLFGYVGESGKVQNVGVVDSYFYGKSYVGGVAGYNNGTLTNCYNTGTVSGSKNYVGGVAGYNRGTVENCYNTGTVSGSGNSVGGVVGYNRGTVENCYNTDAVSGSGNYVGGVVGRNLSAGTVENCYYNTNTYSGSAVGEDSGTVTNVEGKTTEDFTNGTVCALVGYHLLGKYSDNGDGTHSVACSVCNVEEEQHSYADGECTRCGAECEHVSYENGFCTECGDYESSEMNGDGYYEISNAGQLYWFADMVNSGDAGINGILTANIVVNEKVLADDGSLNGTPTHTWTPIGKYENQYTGTFDGAGYSVSGLYFNDSTTDCVGLFSCVGEGGTVQNVGVVDSYFYGESYVGGVAGYNNGTLTNCYNTGTVSGSYYVGGVVGFNYSYETLTNCYNTGDVGGSGNYVGGVVGFNRYIVENCYNTGTVSGSDYVGGVAGKNNGTLTNCYNTGDVGGSGNYVGGVAGYNNGTLANCYNTGDVGGSNYVGGVVGYNDSYGNVKNCYNTGDVSGSGNHVGGVAGKNYYGTLTNCYYNTNTYSGSAVGEDSGTVTNVEGKTAEDFTNGTGCALVGYHLLGKYSDNGDCTHRAACSVCNVEQHSYADGECTICGTECEHIFYEIGICTECGVYESAEMNGDGYYEISNAGQLYWFADMANSGDNGINGILTADIVVNEKVLADDGSLNGTPTYTWTPIGKYENEYKGTFEGAGYSVSGLYFDDSTTDYVGLFGGVGKGGKVQNVGVVDSYFCGDYWVGGVASFNYGTLTNCYSTGTVGGSGNYVGGVAGYNNGTLTNCYNTGDVGGSNYVGGVAGFNDPNGTVKNCYNTGTVSGNNYIGGVAGYNNGPLTNCYNTGAVSGSDDVGGVAGKNNSNGTVENCYYNTNTYSGSAVGEDVSNNSKTAQVTSDQLESGEVTYLLNNGVTDGSQVWYQTIGEADYPQFSGKTVYLEDGIYYNKKISVTLDGVVTETDGYIVLGTDNEDGTYSLPENVVGYYVDDSFVDAGKYQVSGGEVITTVDFNVTMLNGAQVRYSGGVDKNGKVDSGNGLRFIATVDRSGFDGEGYGMIITAEGSTAYTEVEAESWQDDTAFSVAITDMAVSNYNRNFTATPFVKVKYDDGSEKTVYGTQTVTRSIYYVASGLLKTGGNGFGDMDESYGADNNTIYKVLNAYVNMVGVRLNLYADGSVTESDKYTGDVFFDVASKDNEDGSYTITVTPVTEDFAYPVKIMSYWDEFVRINNNNSVVKKNISDVTHNEDGGVTFTFTLP